MKITIETTSTKEIELPKYFKDRSIYYMVKDESFIEVTDFGYQPSVGLFPSIEVREISSLKYHIKNGFEPISEEEFKTAFIRVSVLIEEIFNN